MHARTQARTHFGVLTGIRRVKGPRDQNVEHCLACRPAGEEADAQGSESVAEVTEVENTAQHGGHCDDATQARQLLGN